MQTLIVNRKDIQNIADSVKERFGITDKIYLADVNKALQEKQRIITIPAEEERGSVVATGGGREIIVNFDKEIYESVNIIVPDIEGVEYYLIQKNENGEIVWSGEENELTDYINKIVLLYYDEKTSISVKWDCIAYSNNQWNNSSHSEGAPYDYSFSFSGKGYVYSYLHRRGNYFCTIQVDAECENNGLEQEFGLVLNDDYNNYWMIKEPEDFPDDIETLNDYSWEYLACRGRYDWFPAALIGKSKDIYLNGEVGQRKFENYLIGVQLIDQAPLDVDRLDKICYNPNHSSDDVFEDQEDFMLYSTGAIFQIGTNNATENIPIALVEDIPFQQVYYLKKDEENNILNEGWYYYDNENNMEIPYDRKEDKFKYFTNNRFIMASNGFQKNYSGWKDSPIRKIILPQLFKALPRDLQKVISVTRKMSYTTNQTNRMGISDTFDYTEDKLIIPSAYELFGKASYITKAKCEKVWQHIYSIYTTTNEEGELIPNYNFLLRYKDTDISSLTDWWLRTPTSIIGPSTYNYFHCVSYGTGSYSGKASAGAEDGFVPHGIAPIFSL